MNDDQNPKYNPWHPMKDAVDLKHLGKLCEECGELSAAISRCIIQGINELEPVTKKPNYEWLEDEIADVMANIELVSERFKLDQARMIIRVETKKTKLKTWHKMA